MKLLLILVVLLIALVVLVPILEQNAKAMSDETTAKLRKWIYPLMLVLIVANLIIYYWL